MADPQVAQKAPYIYKPEKDEKVAWCACGMSKSQPFCDGSHRGSEFRPIVLDVQAGQDLRLLRLQADGQRAHVRRHALHAIGVRRLNLR